MSWREDVCSTITDVYSKCFVSDGIPLSHRTSEFPFLFCIFFYVMSNCITCVYKKQNMAYNQSLSESSLGDVEMVWMHNVHILSDNSWGRCFHYFRNLRKFIQTNEMRFDSTSGYLKLMHDLYHFRCCKLKPIHI